MEDTIKRDTSSDITIGDSIQSNNKVLIKIMLSLVVFSAIIFII